VCRLLRILKLSWTLVAHACNSSYLGDWDQEDLSWRPALTNGSRDPISKITKAKWTEVVAQAVEHLLCKGKALSSNPSPTKNKQTKTRTIIWSRDTTPGYITKGIKGNIQ
jgi:hypothetical protein